MFTGAPEASSPGTNHREPTLPIMSLFTLPSEQLLHFIWQGLRFDHRKLQTTCGKSVSILETGVLNEDQGPDFLQAQLKIDGIAFHGHVEIHVDGRDWYRHRHQSDPHYNPVILHVVFSPTGRNIESQSGHIIPELVIGNRIAEELLTQYDQLRLSQEKIACESQFSGIPVNVIQRWVDRLAIERMQDKAQKFQERLNRSHQHWEQVLWEEIAARMAGPVNEEAFRDLARRVPASLLNKYRTNRDQLEALMLGGAGMLHSSAEGPVKMWKDQWQFLQAKYQIAGFSEPVRFLRMRPASFPTFRLSQLAHLWNQSGGVISYLETTGIDRLLKTQIQGSEYWKSHIRPGESATPASRVLGKTLKAILIVNVLLPLGWLYQVAHGRENPFEWLEENLLSLPAETNKHTRIFTELGVVNTRALESQALIQLHKQYCLPKRCLNCHLGQFLLERSPRSARSDSSA